MAKRCKAEAGPTLSRAFGGRANLHMEMGGLGHVDELDNQVHSNNLPAVGWMYSLQEESIGPLAGSRETY